MKELICWFTTKSDAKGGVTLEDGSPVPMTCHFFDVAIAADQLTSYLSLGVGI